MVRDVRRALAFYAGLGFQEVFRDDDTAPMFAMVELGHT
jgi:catechol 2,3-dioxygenase-like lactoylglutathione lyase family enzyme